MFWDTSKGGESDIHDGLLIVGRWGSSLVPCGLDVLLLPLVDGALVLPGGAPQDGDQVQRPRLLQLVGQLCRGVSMK